MHDLAVIVVSTNDRNWLGPCLRTLYEHCGDLEVDVVIADNESTDGTADFVRSEFPAARVVPCRNRGFGHANNRALMTCDARWILFLNPDTEVLQGSLAELIVALDRRLDIGLASVRQLTGDGQLFRTMFRFPNAMRAFGEAIGYERLGRSPAWLGARILDERQYELELDCDWLTGAFTLIRREALIAAGAFDERFFMSSEETDLAYRIRQAGWRVVHLPQMTILHHVHMGKPLGIRMEGQYVFARRQYAEKHFSWLHRLAYLSLLRLRLRRRFALGLVQGRDSYECAASRYALRVLRGAEAPPYGAPPQTAAAPPDGASVPAVRAGRT